MKDILDELAAHTVVGLLLVFDLSCLLKLSEKLSMFLLLLPLLLEKCAPSFSLLPILK